MFKRLLTPSAAALPLAALLTACATIMHGTTQGVTLASTPSSARVLVDGKAVGTTPAVAKLARKTNHVVRFELDGYQPFEAPLTRKTSGWAWGNLIFGGLIGIAIDAGNGALYELTPTQLAATMGRTASVTTKEGLYVAVVLRPDPAWTKVGQLEKE
jgi:hypothetical protein